MAKAKNKTTKKVEEKKSPFVLIEGYSFNQEQIKDWPFSKFEENFKGRIKIDLEDTFKKLGGKMTTK